MPKGKPERSYIEAWTGLEIGHSVTLHNVHRGTVITSFNSFARARNLDWKCATIVEGPRSDGRPPKKVVITRIDPNERAPNDHELRLADRRATLPKQIWEINVLKHRYGYDQMQKWKAQKRLRTTHARWQELEIGEMRLAHGQIHAIKRSVLKACVLHGALRMRFFARRVTDPLRTGDLREWYRVERVTDEAKPPEPGYFFHSDVFERE